MIEICGHIGSFFLMICGIPQLYKTIITKDVTGLSATTLVLWGTGCVLTGLYVYNTSAQLPLLINYGFNSLVVGINTFLYFLHKKPK